MITEPEELVGLHWPLHGPYDPQRLADAFAAAAELVRYANYATQHPEALPSAPEAYPALGTLAATIGGLPQLVGQLAVWTRVLAEDPSLRHDQHRQEHDQAVDAAKQAAMCLREARCIAEHLHNVLSAAHQRISHLYHQEEPA